jgi:hypothetical protein
MAARPAVVLEQRELLFPTGLNSRHRRADAANRVLCRNRFLHVGLAFAEGPIEHFGLDRARRDTVDADALLGELQRSRLGEANDGELAGDVNRRAGKADVPADGGIIDDGTTTGPKYGRDFVLHRQQHATDVDVADLMVVLDRLLGGEQAELAFGAGVVERDVQSAVGTGGLFDKRDDVILPADIGLHERGAGAKSWPNCWLELPLCFAVSCQSKAELLRSPDN